MAVKRIDNRVMLLLCLYFISLLMLLAVHAALGLTIAAELGNGLDSGFINKDYNAFDPYGNLIARDDFGTPRATRLAHQGLMVDRLDEPWNVDALVAGASTGHPGGSTASPAATPRLIYLNRNRIYDPLFARFNQRDPNETALPLLGAALSSGAGIAAPLQMLDINSAYSGGMNLYGYQSSNPINHTDPMGLDWYDEEVDDLVADRLGHALYTMGMLNEGAKIASLGLNTAVNIAMSLLPGSGLYDAFKAVQVLRSGKGGFWEAIDIATVAFPIAKKGIEAIYGLRGLTKVRGWLSRTSECVNGARNCFVAGTLVETPNGQLPIESLCIGDEVITRPDGEPSAALTIRKISRVFHRIAPAILWITLANGETIGTMPGHVIWTSENAWVLADDLAIGDHVQEIGGDFVEVVDLWVDQTPTVVYNLEVRGAWTYFAQNAWVHNRSYCQLQLFDNFVPGKLRQHVQKHGDEWIPPLTEEEYLARASEFLYGGAQGGVLEKIRSNGDVLRYNPITNEFGIRASNGTIRTFFKPIDGMDYWRRQ